MPKARRRRVGSGEGPSADGQTAQPDQPRESVISGQLAKTAVSLIPYIIVFTASACTLVIEIVAGRILAPDIGVSLYTWTSIIGVVLAGISIGNYLGGVAADRYPHQRTLGLILLAGGLTSLSVLPLVGVASDAYAGLSLVARIVFLTATLFFLPSLILGMVTPVVIKLRLVDLAQTGNVVGKIYAISTAGGIFGTFVTGFVLIQWVGSRSTLMIVAVVLVALALAFGDLWRARLTSVAPLGLFIVLAGFTFANGDLNSGCLRESNYFCIKVEDTVVKGRHVKVLLLDKLNHGFVSLGDPTFLGYPYEEVFADVASYITESNSAPRVLFIGGGAYTMPRYIELTYPASSLEVIEIDPAVTEVAFEYLKLPRDTQITTYNEDARMALPRLQEDQYDLVIGDAFNDLSVPYHLTTREFNEQVKAVLNDQGVYAVNVVDKLQSGKFLRAYVNTLRETFPYVSLLSDAPLWQDDNQSTYVVVGSQQPLPPTAFERSDTQTGPGQHVTHMMPEDVFAVWLDSKDNLLLTDDHAPVDNLMLALHLSREDTNEAFESHDYGAELQARGQLRDAIAEYDRAINLDPEFVLAYYNRATAYDGLGEYPEAIDDLDEAIRLEPEFALAHYALGRAYQALGLYQTAIESYDDAVQLDPRYAAAYNNRATAYGSLGDDRRAILDLDEAISLDPDFAAAFDNRGHAYHNLGEVQLALSDYSESIRLEPQLPEGYRGRGKLYIKLEEFDRVIQDYDEVIQLDQQNASDFNNRGYAYRELEQYQRAVQDFTQAIQLDERYTLAYGNRAVAYFLLGQDLRGEEDAQRAVELGFDSSLLQARIEEIVRDR